MTASRSKRAPHLCETSLSRPLDVSASPRTLGVGMTLACGDLLLARPLHQFGTPVYDSRCKSVPFEKVGVERKDYIASQLSHASRDCRVCCAATWQREARFGENDSASRAGGTRLGTRLFIRG